MKAHDLNALVLEVNNRSVSNPVVKVKTGGGTLEAFEINEIQDTNTYTLPLAASVESGGWVVVELSDKYSAQTPTVQRAGSDTISDSEGTDTSVLFDGGSIAVRFISDGVSDWRL